ncbi:MAG TPA: transposase [Bacteroidales bacterium]|nr:transposase [Bacteroidales bacterium]
MSQGTVANMLARVTKSVEPIYKGIQQSISEAAVVGSDETSVKVKGQTDWMWVWQSQSASFISYEQSRGYASIIKNFPNGFKNSTLVSDALSAPRDELLKLFDHLLELNPEEVDKLEALSLRPISFNPGGNEICRDTFSH